MKYQTSDRLKQIAEERGLKQVDILKACQPYCKQYNVKLAKNDLSQYFSGKVQPRQDKLSILGMALNVNEVWLMGYEVPRERTDLTQISVKKSDHDINTLLQEEYGTSTAETFEMFLRLDSSDRAEIKGEIKQMLKADKYIKNTKSQNA